MEFNACFLFLLLSATLIQANPALKTTEKKSLTEESKADASKENLKIEETGEDKDRSKKAALCLQIDPIPSQTVQTTFSEHQLGLQNIPLVMQAQSVPQQLQSLSIVQPVAPSLSQANIVVPQQMIQPCPQANMVLPQQVVNPVQTLQIVQPPTQLYGQSASSVNIIQSTPQNKGFQIAQKPKPKPKPTAHNVEETESVKELPKPMRMEKQPMPLPAPQESLSMMPIVPTYQQEQMMLIPETEQATFIQIPSHPISGCSNPLHGLMTECTCQKMDSSALNMMPVASYPATYASMTMPHMVANQVKLGPQARTKTYVNVNIPHSHTYQPPYTSQSYAPQEPIYQQKTYTSGLNSESSSYAIHELADNSYAKPRIPCH
ncbi:uncharacterized protein LOC143427240 [Xylocopa sonorina]|uniref:uncharacterized protein LOC143427240 n=1 Tax=Xylocopa sonorina TaxID=1818115 RepID=UPI00403A9A95